VEGDDDDDDLKKGKKQSGKRELQTKISNPALAAKEASLDPGARKRQCGFIPALNMTDERPSASKWKQLLHRLLWKP
jgi:hypothetical protein